MNPPPPLPVVCLVLEDGGGRVLVAQRPAHRHLPLKWEFPGGKVEPGESPAQALVREIQEELGADVLLLRPLPRFIHDYGDIVIEMFPFVGRLAPTSAPPQPREHVAFRWLPAEELESVDLAAADLPVVASYRS